MRGLRKDLGGYQCMKNGIYKDEDILVKNGEILGFYGDASPLFNMYKVGVYRKMPVAKQGDLDHAAYSQGDTWETPPPKSEAQHRKERPIASGVLDYFPGALMEVAYCSYMGNKQHNTGENVTWDRSKSADESDALIRHFMKRGTLDTDGVRHSAKVAWRALAMLQKEIENEAHPTP